MGASTGARPWRTEVVRLPGVELCVSHVGDSDAATVLLVAGAASSMDWWEDELCERIAVGCRHVVRYDHRDTGSSTTWPPGAPAYDGSALSGDCAGLVRHLGPRPVHLVGLSMGGGIAQELALRDPERIASLTLLSTSAVGGLESLDLPGPLPRLASTWADPAEPPDFLDPDAVVEHLVAGARAFAGGLGFDEARVHRIARRVVERSIDASAAGNHWQVVGDEEGPPLDVHDITVPTLVVHGSDDPLFPIEHGEALASAVPGARLLVLPGMGHEHPPPSTWDLLVPALLAHTDA